MQAVHDDWPAGLKVPTPHAMHAAADACAAIGLYVPAAHAAQSSPVRLYAPATHTVHVLVPVTPEYDPRRAHSSK